MAGLGRVVPAALRFCLLGFGLAAPRSIGRLTPSHPAWLHCCKLKQRLVPRDHALQSDLP